MGSPHSFVALVAFSLSLQFATAQTITKCPTAATSFTGADGLIYALCPSTDLQGQSDQIIGNIASAKACVQSCSTNPVCVKAVYDSTAKNCHVKNRGKNALTWVEGDAKLTTIYLNNKLPEASNIARCPYKETSSTVSGKAFKTCGGTDTRGPNTQMVKDIANTAGCAMFCANAAGCVRAVYDKQGKVCHIKADATKSTQIWSTNKQFDTIRLDVVSNPGTLGSWSDLVRLPVIPVAAYVVPSFPEASRLMFFSSWGTDAFGGDGGKTQFADYDYKT